MRRVIKNNIWVFLGGILIVFVIVFFFSQLFLVKAAGNWVLNFDGVDDYMEIPDDPSLNFGTGDFTVEAWVKPANNNANFTIIKKGSVSPLTGYRLLNNSGYLEFVVAGDGDELSVVQEGLTLDIWHHVIGIRENRILKTFIDGVKGTQEIVANLNCSSTENFYISESNIASLETPFWGMIDEVRIYNRALTENEVAQHYQGTFINETGLVGYWNFNEGSGDVVTDSSSEGNNGTIYGATWVERVTPISPTPAGGARGVRNTNPEVKLSTPIIGTYNKILAINYSAFDSDSGIGNLKPRPIIIFYSDDGGINWKEAARDQLNTGIYNFDTTAVPDGANYRIRIVALDGYDYFGDAISEIFTIDNTSPTFDISISPSPVREKDTITLKIISSEELKVLPKLQIIQKDAWPKTVIATGSGREFSALYYVERGSGKAIISISGEDLVGNVGEVITSGGSFLVDFYGPPPPIISSPINNQIFTEQVINVIGSSQPDTKIILTLNGVTKFTIQSSDDGTFKIDKVGLSTANKGSNTLSIVAINERGEESGEVVLKIKFNIPPKISSTSIATEETLSGEKEIVWTSSDLNDDKLVFSIEYSNDGGISWDYIISDFSETSYKMDTLQLADGSNYFLKITADDGIEKTSQTFKNITIKNNLPHISLDIPLNYFTNVNTPTLTGKVTGSGQNIALAEYSLDGGISWKNATALDGNFDSLIEKIKIAIQKPLADGKYTILIRVVDAINRSVKISRSFTLDTTPPFIEFSLLDKIVDNSMDTNLELEGLQITFRGKTEPEAKIEFILEEKTYKTTANEKGEFEVKDVNLFLHGSNKISLTSSDLAKNVTNITGVVISNNPPQISVLSLEEGDFLGGVKEITWEIKDLDNDPIISKIIYQRKNEEWVISAKDITGNIYKWNISKISNGEYKVKIIFSDGMSEVEKILNVFIDNVVPQVTFSGPSLTNIIRPTFSGEASDDFSGIQYVEYSFNNVDWYKASIIKGYQTQKASFLFRPRLSITGDGNYKVMVRVTDQAGNITYADPKELIIDTTPPHIGSILISSGALILFPDRTGVIKLFKDTPYKILFSVAKETKEVTLRTKEVASAQETIFGLSFNKAISLWESEINFRELGDYSLVISVRDEVGNSQDKEIAFLKVILPGVIYDKEGNLPIEGAKITLFVFDRSTNSWSTWDGQAFNQDNPQKTNEKGEYSFLIPPGKYRLEVSKLGFGSIRSEELAIENNYFININIPLVKGTGLFNKILDFFIK